MSIPRRDPFSILNKDQNKWLQPEPLYKRRTTQRYKAGQAPQWELDDDDIFTEESDRKTMISLGNTSITSEKMKTKFYQQEQEESLQQQQQQQVIKKTRRIIQETEIIEEEKQDKKNEMEMEFPVPKVKNQTLQSLPSEKIEEIDMNSEVMSRRARLKQKLQQVEEQVPVPEIEIRQRSQQPQPQEQEQGSEDDDSFEEQSDSQIDDDVDNVSEQQENDQKKDYLEEQEQREAISLMKPVFVPREVRETREKYIEEEIALEEEKKATEQRKKQETKLFVIEAIRNKNKEEEENSEGEEMPDDDDNINEKLEYESWKVRELKRIHRDREESNKYEKEQKEILRRRNLTDEQRIIENIKLGSDQTELKKLKDSKTKYRFMQKFYKIGAFYLDSDDPLFKRDYNIAVGEDLRNKSELPKYLQKRRGEVGMRGQSKYTHLTDQDTNNFDPFYKIDEQLFQKQLNKTAGYKGTNVMDRSNLKKVKL